MPPDDPTTSLLLEAGAELASSIEANLAPWCVSCVARRMTETYGAVPAKVVALAEAAGSAAVLDVGHRVRELLQSDVDEQYTTPLALVRDAVKYPTKVLIDAGVPPRERDAFTVSRFPDDRFDLTPSSLSALDEQVGELAIVWGAAKAFAHKRRHQS